MKKILAILLTLVFVSGVFAYAAPFPDLPADHWATEAVKVLAEKGLVEGYPNGTFKGNRAATRYEVAMVVARLIAYLEKRPQVTKEDLEAIKRLVDEFKDELDAMGVRLKNVEDLLADLERRVTELERVRFSGGFETRYVTSSITTCAGCVTTPFQFDGTAAMTRLPGDQNPTYTPANWNPLAFMSSENMFSISPTGRLPLVDQNRLWNSQDQHNADREANNWNIEDAPFDKTYDVYPVRSGTALTQQGYLKVSAKLGEDYTAGGVVSMYNDVGSLANGYIYGVTPNTIANPFQAGTAANSTAGSAFFGTASNNLAVNLNQIYVTNDEQNLHVSVGDWRPALIPDHILQGLPNMGVYGPDYLPFYGGQLYGQLGGTVANGLMYEAVGGRLDQFAAGLPTTSFNYQNIVLGGALAYEWKNPSTTLNDVKLTGSYVRVMDDSATAGGGVSGGINNPGLWANPSFSDNIESLNSTTGTTGTTPATVTELGPQTENLYGAELKIHFGENLKWLNLWGKYGNSQYNVTRGVLAPTAVPVVTGSMASAGLLINPEGRISGAGEFVWVQPQYDPFVAQVPIPNGANGSQSAFIGTGAGFSTMFMGFPYPVSYGAPFTTFIGNLALTAFGNGTTPPFTSSTGGVSGAIAGGDAFYNIHDSRKYPNNRTGGRGELNWNFGPGNLGVKYEYLTQVTASSIPTSISPGFYEPIFVTIPTALVGTGYGSVTQTYPNQLNSLNKGTIKTVTALGDYTFPSHALTVDGLFTNARIKRSSDDFNNIDLSLYQLRGGLTYRPAEKWAILGGYEMFYSGGPGRYLRPASNQTAASYQIPTDNGGSVTLPPGANVPANMLFSQKGPYFGLNYSFVRGADAWLMYRLYNLSDNNLAGAAGFGGAQLQSGLRFIF